MTYKPREHRNMCQNPQKQASAKLCNVQWEGATNLRNIRVPVNVANVVIGQAGKEINQMLQRRMTTC